MDVKNSYLIAVLVLLTGTVSAYESCEHDYGKYDGFKCKNGECINPKYMCDGEADCIDESDESWERAGCTIHNQRRGYRCYKCVDCEFWHMNIYTTGCLYGCRKTIISSSPAGAIDTTLTRTVSRDCAVYSSQRPVRDECLLQSTEKRIDCTCLSNICNKAQTIKTNGMQFLLGLLVFAVVSIILI
ncbi:low-density lipoprotein receptor-like [Lingula anatina]|uniref:Low-density lipoprotein receptor-like n=1 Tax=Lingula anatina TaxID=7574 RepID=A0A1S3JVP5_LINAN|nr:low-density lipoprotein receptor-like [Lingula anatina]|eukprot:XP_013414134.1 low-density lipoprotein receptor-like [Lingula anatina]